ncbi:MAG: endonuclease [Solirubrobacterales bacterium]
MAEGKKEQQYSSIIKKVFDDNHAPGATRVPFVRPELEEAAIALGVPRPKNMGDVPYAFRMRRPLPKEIMERAPDGMQWVIRLAGRGKYAFEPVKQAWFRPNLSLGVTKVPDATPALISRYALSDEQALLAVLRYNRLVDVFSGVTCYSLQSHLRTTVPAIGQIETDEIYLGVDVRGAHYLFPVQAKGGTDYLGVVQIEQDFALARKPEFENLIPRCIGAQFVDEDDEETPRVVLFEFEEDSDGEIVLARERHYRLVPEKDITSKDLETYSRQPFD